MSEVSASEDHLMPPTPPVVFIAGSGRSGSTLVERALGAVPGYVNVGELIDLPRRVAPGDELCGCGVTFSQCPFWTAVGSHLSQGWDAAWLAELHRLQSRVARQRHLPRLLAGAVSGQFGEDLGAYARQVSEIYRAVVAESGAGVVVDASKWPSLALALHEGGLDIRVVHLVRDARGVAHSLSRNAVERPHVTGDTVETMYRNSPASAAGRWLATQTETDLLAGRAVQVHRMAYEDFVLDPARALAEALHALGLPVPADGLGHVDGHRLRLAPSHGLSGNPARFRHGTLVLRTDERWRDEMSALDRLVVGTIAAPQLFRSRRQQLRRPAEPLTPETPTDRAEPSGEQTWPLVSVVLPTRGRRELAREAVASVVAQDYPGEIQLIVVHDQEDEDPSLATLAAAHRSVTVTSNARTPGLTGARNTGLELARGEFVASLDDDDTWHRQKIRRQIERFHADPDVLALGSGIRLLLAGGKTADWYGRDDHVTRRMLLRNRIKELHSSTLIMRRDAFAKAGNYDERLPHGYGEDYDIVLRISRVGRIGIVREPLADIRKDGGSYYLGRAANTAPALEHFLARHPEIAEDRRGHARMLGQMAFARSCLGERALAARLAVRGLGRWPLSPHPYVALAHVVTGADAALFARAARRLGRGMA